MARLTAAGGAAAEASPLAVGDGCVILPGSPGPSIAQRLTAPFVFERQRLPDATFFPVEPVPSLARRIIAHATSHCGSQGLAKPWRLHAYAAHPNAERSLTGWAARLQKAMFREGAGSVVGDGLGEVTAPAAGEGSVEDPRARGASATAGPPILQLCAVAGGVWGSLAPPAALSNPNPGGVHRSPPEPLAPSRSYLKLEEALQLYGVPPRARERVIDLGAAPGGWSYAFLKRGCRVLAVDHAPVRLKAPQDLAGEFQQVRANGLTYRPPKEWLPVDWLACDMLVAPGPALGLLRNWLQGGWMRNFIVNIKLPQRDPLVALAPVRDMLDATAPGYRMRQLYHDRREVTVMGGVGRRKSAPGRRGR